MNQSTRRRCSQIAMLLSLMLLAGSVASGQDQPKREVIQAIARGEMRAAGKLIHITITIESYSTPADQKTLIDAFQSGGHDALVKALSKMKSRGRVAITGSLGYQIAYIRNFPGENGRTIRLITDRPINVGEAAAAGRTLDYDLSAVELNLASDPKKSQGNLVLAGRFKVDKNNQVTFETYGSGPWRLTNIEER